MHLFNGEFFRLLLALVGWVMATLMVELDWNHHHNCNYQMPGFKITRGPSHREHGWSRWHQICSQERLKHFLSRCPEVMSRRGDKTEAYQLCSSSQGHSSCSLWTLWNILYNVKYGASGKLYQHHFKQKEVFNPELGSTDRKQQEQRII